MVDDFGPDIYIIGANGVVLSEDGGGTCSGGGGGTS